MGEIERLPGKWAKVADGVGKEPTDDWEKGFSQALRACCFDLRRALNDTTPRSTDAAAPHSAEVAKRVPREPWISVDDAKPEPCHMVLIGVDLYVGLGYWSSQDQCWVYLDDDEYEDAPTHWMPLPPAPAKCDAAASMQTAHESKPATDDDAAGKSTLDQAARDLVRAMQHPPVGDAEDARRKLLAVAFAVQREPTPRMIDAAVRAHYDSTGKTCGEWMADALRAAHDAHEPQPATADDAAGKSIDLRGLVRDLRETAELFCSDAKRLADDGTTASLRFKALAAGHSMAADRLESFLSAQPEQPAAPVPKVRGVSRPASYDTRCLIVSFDRRPTDDEMRSIHELLAQRAAAPIEAPPRDAEGDER